MDPSAEPVMRTPEVIAAARGPIPQTEQRAYTAAARIFGLQALAVEANSYARLTGHLKITCQFARYTSK